MNKKDPIQPGARCMVNAQGDIYMEARAFVYKPCVVIKVTKSGLIQVALEDNPKQTYSVPRRNIDLL